LHNLCQQLIKSNDELTKTDQLKSQLQNQQFTLKVILKWMTNLSSPPDNIIWVIALIFTEASTDEFEGN